MKPQLFIGIVRLPIVRLRKIKMRLGRKPHNCGDYDEWSDVNNIILDNGGNLLLDDGGVILLDD